MAPYLTAAEAQTRLAAYNVTATLSDGDMEAASTELDALGPFIGSKYAADQARQFPRDAEPDGSTPTGTVPPNVLDAVAFLALDFVEDGGPPVTSEGAGGVSVSYAKPKRGVNRRRFDALIASYLKLRGYSTGGAPVDPANPFG